MKKPKKYWNWFRLDEFRLIPYIKKESLLWKDKYGTPRCEASPQLEIKWLWFHLLLIIGDDEYWEQWLWIRNYGNNGNIKKAEETWMWVNNKGLNTWNKELIKKNK